MGDHSIIKGYSDIVNRSNIRSDVKLKDIEAQLVNRGIIEQNVNPTDRFNEELRERARKLGITFGKQDIPRDSRDSQQQRPAVSPYSESGGQATGGANYAGDHPSDDYDEFTDSNGADDADTDAPVDMYKRDQRFGGRDPAYRGDNPDGRDTGHRDTGHRDTMYRDTMYRDSGYRDTGHRGNSELYARTQEQERRAHIDNVMRDIGPRSHGLEHERLESDKLQLLNDIDSLYEDLENEGVDLSRITRPDTNTPYDKVAEIHRQLYLKYDLIRTRTLGEEAILAAAAGLEELFDGKKTWWGRRPDMTDYSITVNSKLRRMRHETTTIARDVVQNMGPYMRMFLEFVPGAFIYSRSDHQSSSRTSSDDTERAMRNLRDI